MDIISEFITPGIIFLLTLIFGFWLSLAGKPYNGILFNLHKLIALGAVVVIGMQIYKALPKIQFEVLPIVLVVVTGLCVLALFITGAMMSVGKLDYNVMLTIHKFAPILATIAIAVTVYLLTVTKL